MVRGAEKTQGEVVMGSLNGLMILGIAMICIPLIFCCIYGIADTIANGMSEILPKKEQSEINKISKALLTMVRIVCEYAIILGIVFFILGIFKYLLFEAPKDTIKQEEVEHIEDRGIESVKSISYNDADSVSVNEIRIDVEKIKEIRVIYGE